MAEPLALSAPARRRHLEVWLPLVIVVIDQITKAMVRASVPLHQSVAVIPNVLDITHVRNTGAAFGFLDALDFPFKTVLLAIIATGALVGVAVYAASIAHQDWLPRTGLTLIIGGAAGNLIDRLIFGSVVDFVDVYFGTWHFWAFNVADSAISIGVALMILGMIGLGTHASKTV
jgi:signal peptidase II